MVGGLINTFELFSKSDMKYLRSHCEPNDKTIIIFKICDFTLNSLAGPSKNMKLNLLPKITKTFPAGASTKQFIHFSQLIMSGRFQSFDYQENNIKRYGRITPPVYKLSKITAQIVIFYGMTDNLVAPEDAENVARNLKNVVKLIKIDEWNHVDFVYASNLYKVINSKIIQIFGNFSGK